MESFENNLSKKSHIEKHWLTLNSIQTGRIISVLLFFKKY
jgi:hypothetical protein